MHVNPQMSYSCVVNRCLRICVRHRDKSGTYTKKFYGSASTLDGTKDALVLQFVGLP